MKHIKSFLSIFTATVLLFTPAISFAISDSYIWSDSSIYTSSNLSDTGSNSISDSNSLSLESGSAILIEQNTGKVLYEHNVHEKLRPASVTKVMSLLLIMEALDSGKIALDTKIPCTEDAASMGGSQIWLDVREELSVNDMLKAICVVSANDCVVAMANYLEGSHEAFVTKMNQKAKEIGMNDTTFKNCHGIDEDGHVTSSYDIALMSRELLMKHPSITNYTTIYMDSLRNGKSELVNTNKLIRTYPGMTGLKTGSTSLALYNLSASATRDSLSLIAVIMKAPSTKVRFTEAQKLLDYGFSNYAYQSFAKQGDCIKEIAIEKGTSTTVEAIISGQAGALVKKGQEKEIVQELQLQDSYTAPIQQNQKLGEITYSLQGQIVGKADIVAKEEVPKITLWNICKETFFSWFSLLRKE